MLDAHLRPRHTSIARLDASNLPALARGCAVLGAGGGGDPALGLTMALHAVAEHGPVTVIDAAELPDEALVMPCGLLGSPTIAEERIWSGEEGRLLAAVAQRLRGEPVGALMAYEIGGVNGLLPVAWAARMGVALVDADGRGPASRRVPWCSPTGTAPPSSSTRRTTRGPSAWRAAPPPRWAASAPSRSAA
jgi:DUF917 family protein